MLLRNLAAALCLYLAGLCNGLMDSTQFHYQRTVFADKARFDQQFWNPAISWTNKYRDGDVAKGEKFFGASTFLVFTTDGWHLFKFGMLKGIVLAIILFLPFSSLLGHDRWVVWGGNAVMFFAMHLAFNLGFKTSYV